MNGYRRRRWTYSFRAWVDERGGNVDREHATCGGRCEHRRLWDLSWTRTGHNLVRIVRGGGRWPEVRVGRRYRRLP